MRKTRQMLFAYTKPLLSAGSVAHIASTGRAGCQVWEALAHMLQALTGSLACDDEKTISDPA